MSAELDSVESITQKIKSYQPALLEPIGNRLASVALVLRNVGTDPEVLFIERAKNKNDPWSGQVAFPGGNKDLGDGDVLKTAKRETLEEVGILLKENALLGRLDDQQGRDNYRKLPLIISCFVFGLGSHHETINNYEVGASFWANVAHLQESKNRFNYKTDYSDDPYPAISLGSGRVLWGLTYRFVQRFLEIIE